MDFKKINNKCYLIKVNNTAAREHMAEIEHEIRLIKDPSCCVTANLKLAGIKIFHKMIVVHCVYFCSHMLNIEATKSRVGILPRELVIDFS